MIFMLQITLASITLPLTDPVLKFLLILVIILAAPLLLNKLRIPHLLGLIIAGAIIGPNGFNLVLRDSSIILSGTAGLLYIMFLAGLEIDLGDFKKNKWKSLTFGLYTFLVPMALGTVVGIYVLNFSMLTSILLASMFASHTLIVYPIISKLGITKDKAVGITVGGTMITDTLALLVLTVIVEMSVGEVDDWFWYRLGGAIVLFFAFVMIVFPIVGRWFFKRCEDNVSQYIFVLVMVFLGAYLAELAGLESIIGAFLAGMALNRLIPSTSPLMNRVEFVGNAIFIPFFLIGVGMLIDYRAFFINWDTIKVGAVMIVVATVAKFIAAWLTQKTFRMSEDQRRVIFGLSNAQAAATLAAVMVGYNVILGETPTGEPIRLLNESVLNGTILMILVTCTIASFSAQKGAHNIAMNDVSEEKEGTGEHQERILIPVSYEKNVPELVNLSTAIKSKKNKNGLFALNVINNQASDDKAFKQSKKLLNMAVSTASATDNVLQDLLRYDLNVANAIISVIKEQGITDLVLGLHQGKGVVSSFLGNMTETILGQSNVTTLIYRPIQPIATVKRHLVVVPARAEKEVGFPMWVNKIWNIIHNSGAKAVFYASEDTMVYLKGMYKKRPIEAEFSSFDDWDDFLIMSREIKSDDTLWVVMSRRERLSYHANM
ncbi:MAG TPA: cation:proton antiporter, partial [Candidatus Butyricimonas faecavium]|nr:cation:proton antiporter [Candidatus Butyricimonas faecavium]